jgi:hypothetical protein
MGVMRNAYKILVEEPVRKRPLGRRRWRDNVKEIGYDSVDWIHLPQDRYQWRSLANTVMKFRDEKKKTGVC